jgi:hypothetical protein
MIMEFVTNEFYRIVDRYMLYLWDKIGSMATWVTGRNVADMWNKRHKKQETTA